MAPLPKETPEGYRIILYRLKNLDPSKLLFNDLVKCFCAFNDVKISEDGLVPGYIVVLDMKGISFSHFMKVTPYVQSIRYILLYLQVRYTITAIDLCFYLSNRCYNLNIYSRNAIQFV